MAIGEGVGIVEASRKKLGKHTGTKRKHSVSPTAAARDIIAVSAVW
jgi:hypothetical protein